MWVERARKLLDQAILSCNDRLGSAVGTVTSMMKDVESVKGCPPLSFMGCSAYSRRMLVLLYSRIENVLTGIHAFAEVVVRQGSEKYHSVDSGHFAHEDRDKVQNNVLAHINRHNSPVNSDRPYDRNKVNDTSSIGRIT